ncbi:MAG: CaiB/BaiF CoA transferase family protein [Alphaproteobacteria bacterium]
MTGATKGSALSGLKIVDLSRVLAGPFCTQILGDHGAEIIKVEPPQGDDTRSWGPPFRDGLSAYFTGVNRNKEAICLDLSRPEGRDVLLRLLEDADAVVENFKSGTMEKWGLGYEDFLKDRFPRLIHCQITGYGNDGPYGGFPGYDGLGQALGGGMSLNGERGGDPLRVGVPIVDLATGLYCVNALLMGVIERQRSGRGQSMELTLIDTAVTLLVPQAFNWFMSRTAPKRLGNAHPNIAPYDSFMTRNGRIYIAAANDGQFRKLCQHLGAEHLLADDRFTDNPNRVMNVDALTAELETLLAEHDGLALSEELMRVGVPSSAVLELADVMAHPHVRHRQMVVDRDGYEGVGIPIKMSRTPGAIRTLPTHLGADSRSVLAAAGYGEDDIDGLIAAGVVKVTDDD